MFFWVTLASWNCPFKI